MSDESPDDPKQTSVLTPRTGEVVFEGNLAALSVPEIVQMACVGRQRSVVEVWCDTLVGVIFVDDGDVVASRTHDEHGDDAFRLLATPRAGRFRAFHAAEGDVDAFASFRTTRRWHDLVIDVPPSRDSFTNETRSPSSAPHEAPTTAGTPRSRALTFDGIMKDAAVAYLRRDYETAERLLRDGLAMRPDDPRALEQLARITQRSDQ